MHTYTPPKKKCLHNTSNSSSSNNDSEVTIKPVALFICLPLVTFSPEVSSSLSCSACFIFLRAPPPLLISVSTSILRCAPESVSNPAICMPTSADFGREVTSCPPSDSSPPDSFSSFSDSSSSFSSSAQEKRGERQDGPREFMDACISLCRCFISPDLDSHHPVLPFSALSCR